MVLLAGGLSGWAQAPAGAKVNPRDARITAVIAVGAQTMDYYAAEGAGPHPAVVIVHGGGFTGGTPRNGSEAYCADFLTPAGYAVFSTSYRLAPGATFTEMVEDVQASVRFVSRNAAKYGVDAGKIVVLGGSAGGYISNMAGLAEPTVVDGVSDRLAAVVTLYGISDVRTMPDPGFVAKNHLIGPGEPTVAGLAAASPITHVKAGAPPFLFVHGSKDESVPLAQSETLQAALRGEGDKADLIVIPGGPHGTWLWPKLAGVPDWEKEMVKWLNGVLGHVGVAGKGIEARSGE